MRRRWIIVILGAAPLLPLTWAAAPAQAAPSPAGRYIVTLQPQVADVTATATRLLGRLGQGRVLRTYEHALKGFVVELPAPAIDALAALPGVAAIERDGVVSLGDDPDRRAVGS